MALSTLTLRPGSTQVAARKASSFRPDIQGLRALAVLLVLIYHAGAGFLPGGFVGVDVFFVISGFLITGILLKEVSSSGSISLVGFYARRAKRILPAATVVLLATTAGLYFLLPRTRWDDTAWQVLGSAFNVVNWVFAADAVDYLNSDKPASAVQHFWTLAVEEQFYLVWPLLLVSALFFARKRQSGRNKTINHTKFQRMAALAVVGVTLPSFAFSIYYTAANPGAAYFVSTTRLWELGIGAMVAIFATQIQRRLGAASAVALGGAGLVAILAAGVLYSSATPFPGAAAALPTLGAAAIIIAGMGGRGNTGVGRLLSVRPATWIGNISFSLYLWHWPMIVIATYKFDGLSLYQGLLIVTLAIIPAYLSYRFIENPSIKSTKDHSEVLQLGALAILVTATVAVSILLVPKPAPQELFVPGVVIPGQTTPSAVPAALFGAELLAMDKSLGEPQDSTSPFTPSALNAPEDNPAVYKDGCHQSVTGSEPKACTYGSPGAKYRVAVVGDSHAAQWVPALSRLAEENNWQVDSYTKSSCPFTATPIMAEGGVRVYDECTTWNGRVAEVLAGPERPDLVLVTGQSYKTSGAQTFQEGLVSAWQQLRDSDVPFAVLLDTPRPGIDVPECVSINMDSLTKCAVDQGVALKNGMIDQKAAASNMGGVNEIDMTQHICPASKCSPIIGNVLVYRDSNHLTATYSTTLAPALGVRLSELGAPLVD